MWAAKCRQRSETWNGDSVSYFATSIVLGDEISKLDSLSLVIEQSPQLGMSFEVDVVAEERPVDAVTPPLFTALQQAAG